MLAQNYPKFVLPVSVPNLFGSLRSKAGNTQPPNLFVQKIKLAQNYRKFVVTSWRELLDDDEWREVTATPRLSTLSAVCFGAKGLARHGPTGARSAPAGSGPAVSLFAVKRWS